MIAQASLDLVPQVLGHDRRVLAFVHLELMDDMTDIDRVRQELIDMPSTEQSAAGRAAPAIDADWNPKVLSVEMLFRAVSARVKSLWNFANWRKSDS